MGAQRHYSRACSTPGDALARSVARKLFATSKGNEASLRDAPMTPSAHAQNSGACGSVEETASLPKASTGIPSAPQEAHCLSATVASGPTTPGKMLTRLGCEAMEAKICCRALSKFSSAVCRESE